MKTAIYIEDGIFQVVVTPESEFEKKALSMFQNKPLDAQVFSGGFYDCRGGWVRQSAYHANHSIGDASLILRIVEPKMAALAATPASAQTAVSEELNEHLDREARAGENYIRKVAGLNEMIAAGEPCSDAE